MTDMTFWTLGEDKKGMKKNFGHGRAGKWEELWLKRLKERLPEQVRAEGGNFTVFEYRGFWYLEREQRVPLWVLDARPNIARGVQCREVVRYPFRNVVIPGN
jgi:hypothetical protein